jgi:hypothetical protein
MQKVLRNLLPLSVLTTIVLCLPASAQDASQSPAAQTTSLGTTVLVPGVYESTVSTISALATSATTALKTARTAVRTNAIRAALSNALMNAKAPVKTIGLAGDTTLDENSLLCVARQSYMANSIYLNYLNTLVQALDTIAIKAAAPTDILSAIKLLIATSSYSITDKVSVKPGDIQNQAGKVLTNCQTDLKDYQVAYYGATIRAPGVLKAEATSGSAGPQPVDTFSFLGPIGVAIDTFLSILQPVLINAAEAIDETRRMNAIQAALNNPDTEAKINTTGQALATAIDTYASSTRLTAAGAFVEQLETIRSMQIDVSSVDDCKTVAVDKPSASGAPNAAFIGCWSGAWAKLKTASDNLATAGDNYDTIADATTTTGSALFKQIMADFDKLKDGAPTNSFLNDVTQFISLANAVATAASKTDVAALKAALAAAEK